MQLSEPVRGMRIGVYPGRGVVVAEARLAAVLAGHEHDHRLVSAERLGDGAERALAATESLGVRLDAHARINRLDLAAELLFGDAADGLRFLNACQRGLFLPRLRQVPRYAIGDTRLESISWERPAGGQRVKLYDAGPHHGTHPPGHRLRLEVELRYTGRSSPAPEQVMALDLAALYGASLRPWLSAGAPVQVWAPAEAVTHLYAQARSGERTRRSAESLAGKVNTLAYGSDLLAPHDRRRRVADLREAGIALDRSDEPHHRVLDLSAPLVALAACWEEAT